jgi:hypothetical protein
VLRMAAVLWIISGVVRYSHCPGVAVISAPCRSGLDA